MRRWTDPRNAPWMAPSFVADGGKDGFLTGPYLSERGEIRDEVVTYADFGAAARELNLRPADFLPVKAWSEQIRPLGEPAVARALSSFARAAAHLQKSPPDKSAYLNEMISLQSYLLSAYRAAHGGDAPLSPEAEAQIEERNRLQRARAEAERIAEASARITRRRAN